MKRAKPCGSLALLVAAIGIAGCATAQNTPKAVDAVLLNTQDSSTREAIRVFVREQSGPATRVDLESLTKSPALITHQRQNRRPTLSRRDLQPVGDYKLMMDENAACWLSHSVQDVVTQIKLPDTAVCAAYRAF